MLRLSKPSVNAGQNPQKNADVWNLGTEFGGATGRRRTHGGLRAGSSENCSFINSTIRSMLMAWAQRRYTPSRRWVTERRSLL
jgi:hypothetical protein